VFNWKTTITATAEKQVFTIINIIQNQIVQYKKGKKRKYLPSMFPVQQWAF